MMAESRCHVLVRPTLGRLAIGTAVHKKKHLNPFYVSQVRMLKEKMHANLISRDISWCQQDVGSDHQYH